MQMLTDALIIARRELRDSLRDWRILFPIIILTLVFPWIMNASTRLALEFVREYSATIIPIRLIPFAVMIVGFFPISFSLIIALESFVGEKERNSLEPLLGTPVTDTALYVGKLISSTVLPVGASYLGMAVYLVGLFFSIRYVPEWMVLLQLLLLTTMEALVMVAGAVVVSAHTTSVRAANLLASFIIIPMAFLLQAETAFLFWGQYDVLWFIVLALAIALLLLIRTGTRTFNREEILAREIDELNLGVAWRLFVRVFIGEKFSFVRLYRVEVPALVRANLLPIVTTILALFVGMLAGGWLAWQHPIPAEWGSSLKIDPARFQQQLEAPSLGFLPRIDTPSIFFNNVRALGAASVLALFSFGTLALILLLIPMGLIGFIAAQAPVFGTDPATFLIAFVLPHGLIELPAAILTTAFALRMGASVIAPPPGVSVSENVVRALADLLKIFVFVTVPLLLIAAWVEATITPQIVLWFYGR